MTDTSTERAIGRLEGKLDSLIQAVAVQGENSRASRKDIYTKLEGIDRKLEAIDGRVTDTEKRQDEAEETTRFVEKIKQRAIGIALSVSFAFTVLGAALALGAQKIWKAMVMQ